MPPALVTAATTSRQWVKAKMGNSMPSLRRISVFMDQAPSGGWFIGRWLCRRCPSAAKEHRLGREAGTVGESHQCGKTPHGQIVADRRPARAGCCMARPVTRARTSTASSFGSAIGVASARSLHPSSWRALKRRASAFRSRITSATSGSRAARSHSSCSSRPRPARSVVARHACSHTGSQLAGGESADRHLGQQQVRSRVLGTTRGGPAAVPACCRSGRRPLLRCDRRLRPPRPPRRRRCPGRRRGRRPRSADGRGCARACVLPGCESAPCGWQPYLYRKRYATRSAGSGPEPSLRSRTGPRSGPGRSGQRRCRSSRR